MSNEELEEYLRVVEPKFNSHLEKRTIEMSLEYYNLLEERMVRLINQNEELKSQLKGTTHCYDETEHRQLKQENAELKKQLEVGEQQYNDLVEEKEKLEEQLSSITLQLKDYKNQVNKGLYNTCLPYKTGYDKAFAEKNEWIELISKFKTQQQEFIKYLGDTISKEKEDLNTIIELMKLPKEDLKYNGAYKFCISFIAKLEEILQKYKEIIGVEDENNKR